MVYDMRERRVSRNISLERLSELTGLTIATLSRIESGIHSPQGKTKAAIESVLERVDWEATRQIGQIRHEHRGIIIDN